ncbi:MAG TPA: peptidoglycan DD-metalloendopeptidase family protein [Thermoanaerobaculaceae bacterium]|nr:peptidoglycan DD-metalloendopeptidase family protein [Thermoanaerobaculaceae bacterium]HRS16879.1 peptidoglycan DD-metalloendopeptidase family protein [Thermoanaerobaculaceae bacterium]
MLDERPPQPHPEPCRRCPGSRPRLHQLGFAALAVGLVVGAAWRDVPVPAPELLVPMPARRAEPATVARRATLSTRETLGGMMGRLGIPARDATAWLAEAQEHLDVRALPVGLEAEAVLDMEGNLLRLRLTPDWRADVVLEREGEAVRGRREPRPLEKELVVVRGTIASSLFAAVAEAGESDDLALALAELFQWDIDFHREVQLGDSFAVLCEKVRARGRTVAYGPVIAAVYEGRNRTFTAYRYLPAGGVAGTYDGQGRALRKPFLRAPLRLSRITSRFSASRMHPVLGRTLPHWGVDYAAPVGTPVMVTGSGTVSFAGPSGGRGNTVEVRHPGGYVTAYLHLSRFAAGIRPGARVEQGQVIGYVGSTGLATGPHVDYRVTLNGRPVNPASLGRDPSPPLPSAEMLRFLAWVELVRPLLDVPGPVPPAAVAALERTAPVPLGT